MSLEALKLYFHISDYSPLHWNTLSPVGQALHGMDFLAFSQRLANNIPTLHHIDINLPYSWFPLHPFKHLSFEVARRGEEQAELIPNCETKSSLVGDAA